MLLGNALKLGAHNTTRPLIWPTLRKAVAFLALLIILTIIEEAVVGLFHGQSIARTGIRDMTSFPFSSRPGRHRHEDHLAGPGFRRFLDSEAHGTRIAADCHRCTTRGRVLLAGGDPGR